MWVILDLRRDSRSEYIWFERIRTKYLFHWRQYFLFPFCWRYKYMSYCHFEIVSLWNWYMMSRIFFCSLYWLLGWVGWGILLAPLLGMQSTSLRDSKVYANIMDAESWLAKIPFDTFFQSPRMKKCGDILFLSIRRFFRILCHIQPRRHIGRNAPPRVLLIEWTLRLAGSTTLGYRLRLEKPKK